MTVTGKLTILFAGAGDHPMYERAFYEAALHIDGIQSDLFTWNEQLGLDKKDLFSKFEIKFGIGMKVNTVNARLKKLCDVHHYDIVFLYSCRLIRPETVLAIKRTGSYVACYCNDNPFSSYFPKYYWRHWIKSLPFCDKTYVYRKKNIKDCYHSGAKKADIMLPYYMESRNYYIPDEEIMLDVPDVVFIGHREKDERDGCLKALSCAGVRVGIRNNEEWQDFEPEDQNFIRLENTFENYNLILNKAKICLVFLSKINEDAYTRRCFEIPAAKTLMLSVYTRELARMFREDKEIVFFRNAKELVQKTVYYLKHDDERKRIGEAGYARLVRDGYCAADRVKTVLGDYCKECLQENG